MRNKNFYPSTAHEHRRLNSRSIKGQEMNDAHMVDIKESTGIVDAEIEFLQATEDRSYSYGHEPSDDHPPLA